MWSSPMCGSCCTPTSPTDSRCQETGRAGREGSPVGAEVFYRQSDMAPDPGGDGDRWSGDHVQRADHVDDLGYLAALDGSRSAELQDLGGAGEIDPVRGLDGLDGPVDPPAVAGVDVGDRGHLAPGKALHAARRVG